MKLLVVNGVEERAVVLRDAAAELELVAVLLFEVERHVDGIGDAGRLVDLEVLVGSSTVLK